LPGSPIQSELVIVDGYVWLADDTTPASGHL